MKREQLYIARNILRSSNHILIAYTMDADELHDHQEIEDETKTKRKKKRLPMPPKEIVPIRCADKLGVEKWDEERAKDLANFPSPARILLIGSCGVGKSTLIKNLIIHARPRFKEVYLIHEDAHATKEYDDLEQTEKFDEVPPLDFLRRKVSKARGDRG